MLAAARTLQLEPYLARKPKALSGGQRQRVAIGRAIVKSPKIFLFDEPLSNLDAELRVQMRLEIASLHQRLGATMIYVTHDQVEAMTLADKIVVLRDGKVAQAGRPTDLYEDPDNMFVAGFIGSPKMNFIEGRVVAVAPGEATVESPGFGTMPLTVKLRGEGPASGDPVTLGVRPEHVALADGAGSPGKVIGVEQLGSVSYLYLTMAGGDAITVEQRRLTSIRPGTAVNVVPEPANLLLFGKDGQRL